MSFQNNLVGFMPAQTFLERFTASARDPRPAPTPDFAPIFSSKSDEDARRAFVFAVEDSRVSPYLKFFIPKLKQCQTKILIEELRARDVSEEDIQEEEQSVPLYLSLAARKNNGRRAKGPRKNLVEYHDFAASALEVLINLNEDEDPFSDPEGHQATSEDVNARGRSSDLEVCFERDTVEARLARDRLLKSAHALFSRQHRRIIFQLVVFGRYARLILFDHSGAVVTQRFDYVHNPDILADFLWRFSHMDDAGRGFDLSAVLATRREVTLLTDAVHDLLYTFQHPADEHDAPRVLPCAELSLDCSDTYPVYKIRVTDDTTGDSTELVVRRPFAGDSSLFGRGTRAYLAYDLKARKLVVLKDTWRAKDRRQRAESAILRELHANDVPFIPQVLYGGDVPGSNDAPQHTVVDELSAEQAQRRCTDTPLLGHIHHRMVQDIFYPLQTVRNERELIQALHDTIITLDIAHQKLGILHRDLSYQNIMLDSQGRCVVNDWDSAGPFTPDGGAVGTVHFMSIRLLRNESLPNEPVDDLQSLFWVLSFAALLCFAQYHGGIRSGLFDDRNAREGGDPSSVSTAKVFSLRDGSLYRGRYCCAALTALVAELADAWAEYQRVLFAPKGACIPALELKPEMLELAARPSYWLEKFAAALAKYDADEREARIADQLEDLAASREDLAEAAAAGGKRKAGDSDVPVAGAQGEGPQLARRSKRLRAIRQRQ